MDVGTTVRTIKPQTVAFRVSISTYQQVVEHWRASGEKRLSVTLRRLITAGLAAEETNGGGEEAGNGSNE